MEPADTASQQFCKRVVPLTCNLLHATWLPGVAGLNPLPQEEASLPDHEATLTAPAPPLRYVFHP